MATDYKQDFMSLYNGLDLSRLEIALVRQLRQKLPVPSEAFEKIAKTENVSYEEEQLQLITLLIHHAIVQQDFELLDEWIQKCVREEAEQEVTQLLERIKTEQNQEQHIQQALLDAFKDHQNELQQQEQMASEQRIRELLETIDEAKHKQQQILVEVSSQLMESFDSALENENDSMRQLVERLGIRDIANEQYIMFIQESVNQPTIDNMTMYSADRISNRLKSRILDRVNRHDISEADLKGLSEFTSRLVTRDVASLREKQAAYKDCENAIRVANVKLESSDKDIVNKQLTKIKAREVNESCQTDLSLLNNISRRRI